MGIGMITEKDMKYSRTRMDLMLLQMKIKEQEEERGLHREKIRFLRREIYISERDYKSLVGEEDK